MGFKPCCYNSSQTARPQGAVATIAKGSHHQTNRSGSVPQGWLQCLGANNGRITIKVKGCKLLLFSLSFLQPQARHRTSNAVRLETNGEPAAVAGRIMAQRGKVSWGGACCHRPVKSVGCWWGSTVAVTTLGKSRAAASGVGQVKPYRTGLAGRLSQTVGVRRLPGHTITVQRQQ